jgi:hypothetical protein
MHRIKPVFTDGKPKILINSEKLAGEVSADVIIGKRYK